MDKNNDEIIAVFMGWSIDNSFPDKDTVYRLDGKIELRSTFKFSSSWDWLIPVVLKIESLYNSIEGFPTEEQDEMFASVLSFTIATPIDEVYKAVVKFIRWYNTLETKK